MGPSRATVAMTLTIAYANISPLSMVVHAFAVVRPTPFPSERDGMVQRRRPLPPPTTDVSSLSSHSLGRKMQRPSSSRNSSSSQLTATIDDDVEDDRKARIQKELEICNSLKVGELKRELEMYGLSTKSFFEKSEFVRAVAEARVDGPPTIPSEPKRSSSSASSGKTSGRPKEEVRDPTYRDVIVTKFAGNKGLLEGTIIDTRARK